MSNQEIIGMLSAHTAAKEMPYGSNMTISASLVIEMVKRIVELEGNQVRAEKLIFELHEQVYESSYLDEQVKLYEALKEPKP
jgi:hypothetical protein